MPRLWHNSQPWSLTLLLQQECLVLAHLFPELRVLPYQSSKELWWSNGGGGGKACSANLAIVNLQFQNHSNQVSALPWCHQSSCPWCWPWVQGLLPHTSAGPTANPWAGTSCLSWNMVAGWWQSTSKWINKCSKASKALWQGEYQHGNQ